MRRIALPTLPQDQSAERRLGEQIRSLRATLDETLRQLADAQAELEIRRRIAYGSVPVWLRPRARRSITEVAMNALERNAQIGLKFAEIEQEILRTGREVHKPSLTACLGRLKRDGKIVRKNGRWKPVSYADREPVEPLEREFERED